MAVAAEERSELVNQLLERIGQTIGEKAHASTIFGEPVEREGITVVPVAKARFGFGGGGGSGRVRKARASAVVEAAVCPWIRSATSRSATEALSSSGSSLQGTSWRWSSRPQLPRA
jgi:hypothetical protein